MDAERGEGTNAGRGLRALSEGRRVVAEQALRVLLTTLAAGLWIEVSESSRQLVEAAVSDPMTFLINPAFVGLALGAGLAGLLVDLMLRRAVRALGAGARTVIAAYAALADGRRASGIPAWRMVSALSMGTVGLAAANAGLGGVIGLATGSAVGGSAVVGLLTGHAVVAALLVGAVLSGRRKGRRARSEAAGGESPALEATEARHHPPPATPEAIERHDLRAGAQETSAIMERFRSNSLAQRA